MGARPADQAATVATEETRPAEAADRVAASERDGQEYGGRKGVAALRTAAGGAARGALGAVAGEAV